MTAKGTVERVAKRRYHLHCSCGATVVTGERTATCPDCGQIVMFRRDLRRRKHTLGDTPTETFLWAPVGIRGTSQTKPDAPMDCNRRFKRAGFLMLLLAGFLFFLFVWPERTVQEWQATTKNPRPRDCDWASMPIGDKHCHYESRVSRFSDQQGGEQVIVNWYRMND